MPKTIVITGTATGMGRATVGKFAAEGWNVVATVRKEPDLKAHAGLRCVKTVLLDVDDETSGTSLRARLTRRPPRIPYGQTLPSILQRHPRAPAGVGP